MPQTTVDWSGMPPCPKWFTRIEKIEVCLENQPPQARLGRAEVAALFGVQRTEAQRILRLAGGAGQDQRWDIPARRLLAWVQDRAPEADRENARRETHSRLDKDLNPAWRKHEFTTWDRIPHRIEDWPTGVTLEPGVLHIRYNAPNELFETLMQVAQIAADDYDRFVSRIMAQSVRS